MPDISMCLNFKCEKRANCYRYKAVPSTFIQSFMKPDERNCTHYWEISSGLSVRSTWDADENAKRHTVKINESANASGSRVNFSSEMS